MTLTPPIKTALVTGGSSGIGLETARGLARQGWQVVISGQDPQRLAAAVAALTATTGNPGITGLRADLAEPAQVRALAEQFRSRHARLDALINNAGVWLTRPSQTPAGIELTWAVNHLAMMQLTLELLPFLAQTGGARIVNVASRIHTRGALGHQDLKGSARITGRAAYARSKLANVMFTYALARRTRDLGVTANALHPGVVASGLWRHMGLLGRVAQLGMISAEAGAQTSLHLASSPEVAGVSGRYFANCQIQASSALSQDQDLQEALWRAGLEQLGMAEPAR